MTAQEVFDNWSAYLRAVDRLDFMKQLESISVPSETPRITPDATDVKDKFGGAAYAWPTGAATPPPASYGPNAREGDGKIEDARSATPCSGWVSVLEKLPESHGDVLVAHPVFSQSSAEMFGVAIRPAYMVRAWMSDKKDDSMRGAYWQNLPKGPA